MSLFEKKAFLPLRRFLGKKVPPSFPRLWESRPTVLGATGTVFPRRPLSRRWWRHAFSLLGAPGAALAVLLSQPMPAQAQVIRDFNSYPGSTDPFRFQTIAIGDITIIGNTLMTCDPGGLNGGQCVNARNGTSPPALSDNNDYDMVVIPGGSSADLTLSSDSTVVFAGLYWNGFAQNGANISSAAQLQTPNGTVAITATQIDTSFPTAIAGGFPYQAFAQIPNNLISNGTFTVSGIDAQAGQNRTAGWALVVVFESPSLGVVRSLSVYDGFAVIRCPNSNDCSLDPLTREQTVNLSGFETPAAGPVLNNLGIVMYDGDRNIIGEEFLLGPPGGPTTQLSALPANPLDDFFNSTISRFGTNVTGTKNPDQNNQLGFDLDIVDGTGVLGNSVTQAEATFSTVQRAEGYWLGVFTVAIETVTNPNLRLVKRITNVTRNGVQLSGVDFNSIIDDPSDPDDNAPGFSQIPLVGVKEITTATPLQSGDIVEYTVYLLSDGSGPAQNVQFCDPIPDGTTYVTDSFGSGTGTQYNLAGSVSNLTNDTDADIGSFSSPLAPLPAGNGCSSQANTNGSALVNVGTLSSTPGLNFASIRFQVSVD